VRLGIIAIARPTFDVPFASATARLAFDNLEAAGHELIGTADLAMDEEAVAAARGIIDSDRTDALVVLQASFTDSSLPVMATDGVRTPIVLWAFPEERTGGRLRLNSFCGINLAGYTLTRMGREYRWLHRRADGPDAPRELEDLLRAELPDPSTDRIPDLDSFSDDVVGAAERVRSLLEATVIGRVGEHPNGFEPCAYESGPLRAILGVRVDEIPLPELFTRARSAPDRAVMAARERSSSFLSGVEELDQASLEASLRLHVGLKSLVDEYGWSGVATRCWPETFTAFGGAACTPMALLGQDGVPGSCEADVYGNVTGLVLAWLANTPSFVADLVDLDRTTGTGVLWHCGLAPFEMADPESVPVATVHSNRRKPLLSEFPLKPGRVTVARFSRSKGVHRLVVGTGEMLRASLAFSGTAGVIRFDSAARDVEATILREGLEHHYGVVYGDIADELRALANLLDIPVVEL
jgi:L-fucose isomerase-like protein